MKNKQQQQAPKKKQKQQQPPQKKNLDIMLSSSYYIYVSVFCVLSIRLPLVIVFVFAATDDDERTSAQRGLIIFAKFQNKRTIRGPLDKQPQSQHLSHVTQICANGLFVNKGVDCVNLPCLSRQTIRN